MSAPIRVVVVGAHLSGQPLNHELVELGATLASSAHTAAEYRMFALAGAIEKPGLVRVREGGRSFEVEVWELPALRFGEFIVKVRSPLCIGSLVLQSGEVCLGFLCETWGTEGAVDISEYAGWRAYRAR